MKWISVHDQMPPQNVDILVFSFKGNRAPYVTRIDIRYDDEKATFYVNDYYTYVGGVDIVLWMPIPPIPDPAHT